jgi:hypothetical protein
MFELAPYELLRELIAIAELAGSFSGCFNILRDLDP